MKGITKVFSILGQRRYVREQEVTLSRHISKNTQTFNRNGESCGWKGIMII
jgi:hypothetical protein